MESGGNNDADQPICDKQLSRALHEEPEGILLADRPFTVNDGNLVAVESIGDSLAAPEGADVGFVGGADRGVVQEAILDGRTLAPGRRIEHGELVGREELFVCREHALPWGITQHCIEAAARREQADREEHFRERQVVGQRRNAGRSTHQGEDFSRRGGERIDTKSTGDHLTETWLRVEPRR